MKHYIDTMRTLWTEAELKDEFSEEELADMIGNGEYKEFKYHVVAISTKTGDEYTEDACVELQDAIDSAQGAWRDLSEHDKKRQAIEIRVYSDNGIDYDTIDWM